MRILGRRTRVRKLNVKRFTVKHSFHQNPEAEHFNQIIKQDSPHRELFEHFVETRYAECELALYDSCTEFHHLGNSQNASPKKLNKLGKKIVSQYLLPESPRAVDVADVLRQEVLSVYEISGQFAPDAFDAIRALLFKELKENFHFAFMDLVNTMSPDGKKKKLTTSSS